MCDWESKVDCESSRDFYSLNSRIGTDEPFLTSVFINFGSRTVGGSTVGSAPAGQLGSPSQARLKTVRPDSPTGKRSGKVRVTSNFRAGNTLLPNTLFVEVPTFTTKETRERPTTEAPETAPAESTAKTPGASSSRQNILSPGRGGEKRRKSQPFGSRLRGQAYLPESTQETSGKTERRDGYLPLEGSGEGPSSSEREGYLPADGFGERPSSTKESNPSLKKKSQGLSPSRDRGSYLPTENPRVISSPSRGNYLPEVTQEVSSPPRGSYLPEESTDLSDSPNYLTEKPLQPAVPDVSFLQSPSSSPELPNSILGAFALPTIDEYSPVPPTTAAPLLPPMNLLPLSNEPAPPSEDRRLPSTTESYGVLDEEETVTTDNSVVSSSRQGFGRTTRPRPVIKEQGKNAIPEEKSTTLRPATEATTTFAAPEFQYDFDRVRNTLQERLRNIERFDVPAETAATSDGATVTPPSGSTRSGGVAPSPWLFSLAKVPMQ